MTALPKLLPCPFCGVEPELKAFGQGGIFSIQCDNEDGCEVGSETSATDAAEAVRSWNKRAVPDIAYEIWTDFVTACEVIECDPAPVTAAKDTPEYHFARGAHSAAKRIRRSVEHPKYRSTNAATEAAPTEEQT